MAITTVNGALDALFARVRDTSQAAHGDVALDVLSDVQRLVNACYGAVLVDDTLAMTANQTVYSYGDVASDIVRIVDVQALGHSLDRTMWRALSGELPAWVHQNGQPRVWDTLGHNTLFIAPSDPTVTLTIRYIKECAALTAGGSFEVPAPYVTLCIDIAAEVLLLRQRLFPSIEEAANAANRHSDPRSLPKGMEP